MKKFIKRLLRENIDVNSLGVNISKPNQELIIMRGIPGSGKSTKAKSIVGAGIIHSTDDLISSTGDYNKFFDDMLASNDFSRLSQMHLKNLENAIKSMEAGITPIIIDNTNIRPFESKPYIENALKLGYDDNNIKIIDVGTGGASAEELANRNTHGVPLNKIQSMIDSHKSFGDLTIDKILQAENKANASKNSENPFRELSKEEELNPFAVFVIVKFSDGKYAATTRPSDRVENEKIGLPGGKVDADENPMDAALREAEEEGWKVDNITGIAASKMVNGKPIVWFYGNNAIPLSNYKEKSRGIIPIIVDEMTIANSGYGNDFIGKQPAVSSKPKKVLYSAVVIDDISRNMLFKAFEDVIPNDWKKIGHHMTIAFGKGVEDESELEKEVGLVTTHLGISDMAIAVIVDGYPSKNKIPHITMAINPNGGKPVMSNDIKNWKPIPNLKIRGIVKNITV
jgi:hypothetical protein